MNPAPQYSEASLKTADNLRTVAQSIMLQDLSRLSLPEIEAAVDAVSQVAPAGNVPGVILNGLVRMAGRRPPANVVKRDINLFFRGVESALGKALYGSVFAGPAAVMWAYQNLLKLAGKEADDAFPEGMWQFYVDYALREDTARHANETRGFDAILKRHQIHLSPVDRLAAWVMASIQCLHQFPHWLANEWRERTCTYLLQELTMGQPNARLFASLYRQWEQQRPYGRSSDAQPEHDFAVYRRLKFDEFLAPALAQLTPSQRQTWEQQVRTMEPDLSAYQQQLSLLAYLEPGPYGETRVPFPLEQAQVGIIHQGRYYLLPVCEPGTSRPAAADHIRSLIAAIITQPVGGASIQLSRLAAMKRATLADWRRHLNPTLAQNLSRLRLAPILINADTRPRHLSLSDIRQGERGIGDHALTIFDTGETLVFDQSHIFFDGAWGASLAETLTREALSWAVYLNSLPAPQTILPPKPLLFPLEAQELLFIDRAPKASAEISVQTEAIKLPAILSLRKLFKQRSDLLELTVNDLLILYRAIHAIAYQPKPELVAQLQLLQRDRQTEAAAQLALDTFTNQTLPPAILIPIDASGRVPRERIYPMVFEVPLYELDLLNLHRRTLQALDSYEQGGGDRQAVYAEFDQLQRTYLATLAGFGQLLSKAKEIAIRGENVSAGSIRMLANLPTPLQRLLDQLPNRFDLMNDLIKGREIFSNVGAVVRSSSLVRFHTAKDDNEKKTMAWGVLTDADKVMRLTLRDFRPYTQALIACGHKQLASNLAQDYLDSYAHGLNRTIQELRRITLASRETVVARFDNQ